MWFILSSTRHFRLSSFNQVSLNFFFSLLIFHFQSVVLFVVAFDFKLFEYIQSVINSFSIIQSSNWFISLIFRHTAKFSRIHSTKNQWQLFITRWFMVFGFYIEPNCFQLHRIKMHTIFIASHQWKRARRKNWMHKKLCSSPKWVIFIQTSFMTKLFGFGQATPSYLFIPTQKYAQTIGIGDSGLEPTQFECYVFYGFIYSLIIFGLYVYCNCLFRQPLSSHHNKP